MADRSGAPDRGDATRGVRRADPASLVFGVLFLAIAAIGILGTAWWLAPHLGPWVAAGVIALIGLAMILSALPGRRHMR
ncbi:MAG: hypothetical protein BGO26_03480 [Actinobacteria bacterium 69-20]|jgi:putative Mn2+ efflux pump MntP|nr:hypothetical protein [Actinomycetota bacterium]OJV23892.1 MAG: hypothetical protein BGO26_03480 [Actinobacteria bacterium 69-20]